MEATSNMRLTTLPPLAYRANGPTAVTVVAGPAIVVLTVTVENAVGVKVDKLVRVTVGVVVVDARTWARRQQSVYCMTCRRVLPMMLKRR